jgi:hypothetical protein
MNGDIILILFIKLISFKIPYALNAWNSWNCRSTKKIPDHLTIMPQKKYNRNDHAQHKNTF